MQKRTFAFAKHVEARFVYCRGPNAPGVMDVYLLNSLIGPIAKSRKIRAACLKTCEGLREIVVCEIVVTAQVLVLRQLMIDPDIKMVASLVTKRHTLKGVVTDIGMGHKLIQQIESRLVHAGAWNLIVDARNGI